METELIAPLGSESKYKIKITSPAILTSNFPENIQNKLLNYIVKNECNVTRDKLIGIETKSFGKPDYNVTIVNILKLFKENNYEKEENVVGNSITFIILIRINLRVFFKYFCYLNETEEVVSKRQAKNYRTKV